MRKIWILAAAVVLSNAAIDEAGLNACINKGDAASCEKTLATLEKSCSGGDALACYFSAEFYAKGLTGYKDGAKAFAIYKDACAAGSAESCYEESVFYLKGDIAPQSFELSGERLKKACDLGSKRACNILELAK